MASSGSRKLESPRSPFGHEESTEGTPETKLTAFSPEEAKDSKSQLHLQTSTCQTTDQNDPFICDSIAPESHKLSDGTSIFFPHHPNACSKTNYNGLMANSGAALSILSMDRLLQDATLCNSSQTCIDSETMLSQHGNISTGNGISRCLKVISSLNQESLTIVRDTLKVRLPLITLSQKQLSSA